MLQERKRSSVVMEVHALNKPPRLRRLATRLKSKILKIKMALRAEYYKNKSQVQERPKFQSEDYVSSQADDGSLSQAIESTSVQVEPQPLPIFIELPIPENANKVFTLFGDLPIELRILIWRFALPGPRIVQLRQRALKASPFLLSGSVHSDWPTSENERQIQYGEFDDTPGIQAPLSTLNPDDQRELDFAWRTNLSNLSGFASTAKAPTLLFTCHESHEVAQQRYAKAFGAHCALPTTWFDYKNDTLLLSTSNITDKSLYNISQHNFLEDVLPRIFSTERALVENIIVDLGGVDEYDYVAAMWLGWIIVMFPNVKNVLYELPGFKVSRIRLEEGWEAQRRREFEVAFLDYREHGTLRYEVKEWREYLAKEHGCKNLIIEELDLGKLLEGLEI